MLLLSVLLLVAFDLSWDGWRNVSSCGLSADGFQLRCPADIISGCRVALTVRTERIIRREEEEQKSGIEREVNNGQPMGISNHCTAAAGHPVRTWGKRS